MFPRMCPGDKTWNESILFLPLYPLYSPIQQTFAENLLFPRPCAHRQELTSALGGSQSRGETDSYTQIKQFRLKHWALVFIRMALTC